VTPERWRQVTDIFHAARGRAPQAQEQFLRQACGTDAMLRAEVDALLAGDADANTAHVHAALTPSRHLEPGTTLGPYRIDALVGTGGMGEVYRAYDARLQRDVAIKLLPPEFLTDPERLRRFEQEARAAAALNHPNILSVHDIGTHEGVPYFVSELLTGETLRARIGRGPLSIEQVVDYGSQIARGLAAAHERGIVHRDVKPENLFLTADGRVKVLDFGIAKAGSPSGANANLPTVTSAGLTNPGFIVGTVPYMSPEQVRGAPTDHRSDIFAVGAVLFEMLTGRQAFDAPSVNERMSAVLTRDPVTHAETTGTARPDVPPALMQIVRHCLEKDSKARFQSASDIVFGLGVLSGVPARGSSSAASRSSRIWALAGIAAVILFAVALLLWRREDPAVGVAPTTGGSKSIAALPLANLSANPQDEYFTDGITDSLITGLARAPGLSVIARTAVFRYKDQKIDPRTAGRELGVQYVVDGSVQRADRRVRVNVRLVDVATGYNVWAEPFDADVKDVFVIQDTISRRILDALQIRAAASDLQAGTRLRTSNEQAYDAYLQGIYYSHQPRAGATGRAIASFEQSVQADPQFALAHAALGSLYMRRFFYDDADRIWEQKAVLAVDKALSLEPDLAEGYLARAQLAWTLPNGFPHDRAVADLKRAIAINPNLVEAYVELGKIYMHIGLLDRAIDANTQALRLDPGSGSAKARRILSFVYLRDCTTGLQLSEQVTTVSRQNRAEALRCAGRIDEAVQELGPDYYPALMAALLARKGQVDAARKQIDQGSPKARNTDELSHLHHAQYFLGVAYALMGDTRQAVTWLKKASVEGLPCYPLFERDPDLDSLRKDPEFIAFMDRLKAQHERFRSTL
jgi:serine/threonine protein kinase/TolB-like protein/lipopolysaccharide biosynthesis regulator YciM